MSIVLAAIVIASLTYSTARLARLIWRKVGKRMARKVRSLSIPTTSRKRAVLSLLAVSVAANLIGFGYFMGQGTSPSQPAQVATTFRAVQPLAETTPATPEQDAEYAKVLADAAAKDAAIVIPEQVAADKAAAEITAEQGAVYAKAGKPIRDAKIAKKAKAAADKAGKAAKK